MKQVYKDIHLSLPSRTDSKCLHIMVEVERGNAGRSHFPFHEFPNTVPRLAVRPSGYDGVLEHSTEGLFLATEPETIKDLWFREKLASSI